MDLNISKEIGFFLDYGGSPVDGDYLQGKKKGLH
jgi:hypothetical protein